MIQVKRAYDKAERSDGYRILVDRLWPRGLSREKAKIDLWLKEIAPSTELRKWFGHDESKWTAFRKRYFRELDRSAAGLEEIMNHERHGTVTLLFSAHEARFNNAVALKEYLEHKAVAV